MAVVVTSTASVADVRSVKCVATGKSLVTASRDLSCASFSQKGVMPQKGLNYMDPNGGKIMCYFLVIFGRLESLKTHRWKEGALTVS